jgi:hypothetical protein
MLERLDLFTPPHHAQPREADAEYPGVPLRPQRNRPFARAEGRVGRTVTLAERRRPLDLGSSAGYTFRFTPATSHYDHCCADNRDALGYTHDTGHSYLACGADQSWQNDFERGHVGISG